MSPEPQWPLDALVSFHYFQGETIMEELTGHGRLRLIADSGAFSAYTQGTEVKLTDYAAWLTRWGPRLYWAAALDVFGDPDATFRNWAVLRDDHGLATVPTLHIGADPALMGRYADQGVDFLALGGMVGMPKTSLLRWLVAVLRYARDHHPNMRFHAWGVSTQSLLEKLPLYSIDSSGLITSAYRYARLRIWDPRTRSMANINLNGHTPLKHQRLMRDVYGVDAHQFLRSHKGNRHALMRVAARSAQLRATHLQRLHQVSPPRWGINPTAPYLPGLRMHVLDGDPSHFKLLFTTPDDPLLTNSNERTP